MSLFFLVFFAMGSFFTYLVARGILGSVRTYGWKETPCEIVSSRVARNPASADADQAFVFDVEYRYEFGGRRYASRQFKRGYTGSDDPAETARLAQQYPAGSRAVCYVDPKNPQNAALRRPNLWTAAIILFPLVFVLVGAGGLVGVWWPRRGEAAGEEAGAQRSISQKAAAPAGKALGCLAAFFGLFFAVGLALLYFLFARPAMHILDARSWSETPCVVLESRVRTHDGDDGDTYSVDVLYEYEFGGKTYQSNRYQFLGGSSSGYQSKADVVARHPAGARTVCYVNPADPQDVVLTRSFSKEYLVGLVPLVFLLAGGGGLLWVASLARKARAGGDRQPWKAAPAAAASLGPGSFAEVETDVGPVTLKPKASPAGKFFGMIFLALFWNGIVSVFVFQAVRGWRAGSPDWFLTLFLVPFVLIGLLFVWGVFYQFLALFNPRPRLTLSTRSPALGESVALEWSFSGAAGRIQKLRIFIEGREESRYRRGTKTHTDKETFATVAVHDSPVVAGGASGSARFTIPQDSMHSFSAANNHVIWSLKVNGEIRSWPDVDEEFELVVRPARMRPQGTT